MGHTNTLKDLKKTLLVSDETIEAYEEFSTSIRLRYALVDVRQKANLTQAELARKINTTAPNISRIENNPEKANMQTILKYLSACNAKIDINSSL